MQDDNQRWQSGASDDGTESLVLQPRFRASICTGENTCEASDAARVARQDKGKAAERAKLRRESPRLLGGRTYHPVFYPDSVECRPAVRCVLR